MSDDVGQPVLSPWVAIVSLLLLLMTGLYGTLFWLTKDEGPDESGFPPAAEWVRQRFQSGDVIFLVPAYATRAREDLGDLYPLAVRDPLTEDIDRYHHVFVFGLFGEAEDLRSRLRANGLRLLESFVESPGIVVDRYGVEGGVETVYSFRDHLREASVHHETDNKRTPCATWLETSSQGGPLGRWSCPQDSEWFYVGPEWQRLGDRLRLCLWAHPPREGRLVIRYPNAPLSGQLMLTAGHLLLAAAHRRPPIHLDVQVAELPPQRFTVGEGESYRRFYLKTPATGTGTVSFAISTPDNGANHFCFEADMRRPKPASADRNQPWNQP